MPEKNITEEIKKLYIVKESISKDKERVLAVCTSRANAEQIILDRLRKLYPFGNEQNLFQLEEIENERLWYRNTHLKIIPIEKFNELIDWNN